MTKLEKVLKDLGTLIDYWDDVDRFEEHVYGANILNTLTDARTWIEDTLKEQPRWISVKDVLPKSVANKVLVWVVDDDLNGDIGFGHYEEYAGVKMWINLLNDESFMLRNQIVTYWMPLPEPPKEEVDEDYV